MCSLIKAWKCSFWFDNTALGWLTANTLSLLVKEQWNQHSYQTLYHAVCSCHYLVVVVLLLFLRHNHTHWSTSTANRYKQTMMPKQKTFLYLCWRSGRNHWSLCRLLLFLSGDHVFSFLQRTSTDIYSKRTTHHNKWQPIDIWNLAANCTWLSSVPLGLSFVLFISCNTKRKTQTEKSEQPHADHMSLSRLRTNLFSRSGWDQRCFTSFFPLLLDHVVFDLTRTHTHTHSHTVSWAGGQGKTDSEPQGFKVR